MSKMNPEVMEQLLKDLAANTGYDLIPEPFNTPFESASIKGLPDTERFLWPVPSFVLNDKEHEEFRKMCIDADIIDTVCTTSFSWPSKEDDHISILLIDVTRRRRGSIKFVDVTLWKDHSDETDMAGICNLLIHDVFPGEYHLAFQMNENAMDLGLDDCWDEQVCCIAACDVISLHPNDHIHKLGYGKEGMCIVADVFDIYHSDELADIISTLKKPAILLSVVGKLCPQIIEPGTEIQNLSLEDKMLLVPNDGYNVDMDLALQLFSKEEVLRQLPIARRITFSDMWRVQIESGDWYSKEPIDFDDLVKSLSSLTRTSNK